MATWFLDFVESYRQASGVSLYDSSVEDILAKDGVPRTRMGLRALFGPKASSLMERGGLGPKRAGQMSIQVFAEQLAAKAGSLGIDPVLFTSDRIRRTFFQRTALQPLDVDGYQFIEYNTKHVLERAMEAFEPAAYAGLLQALASRTLEIMQQESAWKGRMR